MSTHKTDEHLQIKKHLRKASFYFSNGSQVEGCVFLSFFDEHHDGSQSLGDLLNDSEQFIPIRTDTEILLANITHLVSVEITLEQELDELMKLGSAYSISIKMISGKSIEGDVFISINEGHGRVKDYANQDIIFLRLLQNEHVVYINQNYILSISD